MKLQNIENRTLIVIARKYNDIFYAVSTEEWNLCKKHILLIVPNRASKDSFTYIELFDEVIVLPPDRDISTIQFPSYLLRLKKMLSHIYGYYVTMSNPEMLCNKFIVRFTHSRYIIFLEDGLLNYINRAVVNEIPKQLVSSIFSINDKKYFPKIIKTYLYNPELAKYYFGMRSKLKLSNKIKLPESLNIPNLNNKKLFISQCDINGDESSISRQEAFINSIIKYFGIDYYVPRTYDFKERITGCEILNINNTGYTLEVLASKYDFEIYGFTTSLLFTTKMINPKIKTVRLFADQTNHLNVPQILNEYVDDVVDVTSIF